MTVMAFKLIPSSTKIVVKITCMVYPAWYERAKFHYLHGSNKGEDIEWKIRWIEGIKALKHWNQLETITVHKLVSQVWRS